MDKHPWKLFLLEPLFFDQKEFVAEIVVFYEMGNMSCMKCVTLMSFVMYQCFQTFQNET